METYNKEEWERKTNLAWDFLNAHDLLPVLQNSGTVSETMNRIDDLFGAEFASLSEEHAKEESIFNRISDWDFAEYVKKRYPQVLISEKTEFIIKIPANKK